MFCITRKQFLDRPMTLDDLAALTDMLRGWYFLRGDGRAPGDEIGYCRCEAHVYAFAQTQLPAIRDATVSFGALRGTGTLKWFPPMPILILSTRFSDGRRHATANRAQYRRAMNPQNSARYIEEGGLGEIVALHRREVDKMIAGGAVPVPVPPPTDADAMIAQMAAEHEESRTWWPRAPYSWGDALHDAFKIPRREYRP